MTDRDIPTGEPSSSSLSSLSRQEMPPPGFGATFLGSTAALAGPRETSVVYSNRDASGGLPPVPSFPSASTAPSAPTAPSGPSGPGVSRGDGNTPNPPRDRLRPIHRPTASKNSIIYSAVQRRNPVLAEIRNTGLEIGEITADYQVGAHNGVLFLSLKYHRLHPEYIHQRIEKMKHMYKLRIILVLCDVTEHHQSLRELTKIAIINEFTVFVAWSNEEIAQYLVTLKQCEHKSADTLKEKVQQNYHDQLQHVLTSGRKVNKTDADNLAAEFGSFAGIARQSAKALSSVKGLGAAKVTSLNEAFTKPFLVGGLRDTATARIDAVARAEPLERDTVGDGGVGEIWHDPLDDEASGARKKARVQA